MYHKEQKLSHIQKSEDHSRKLARLEADQEPKPQGAQQQEYGQDAFDAMVTVTVGTAANSPK